MTVDPCKMQHRGKFLTRTMSEPWYDVTADTEDELHAFAAQLGFPARGSSRARKSRKGALPGAASPGSLL